MPILTVESSDPKLSALEFLQHRIPAAPRAFLRQLLKTGKVVGESGPLTERDRLTTGTVVQLPDSGRLRELLTACLPASQQVDILFESREILVADKPAGLAVHASLGHEQDNLTARVKALLAERRAGFKIAPAHRLDLGTSGPVMYGKGQKACAELGRLLMRDEVEKRYLALVVGKTAGSGVVQTTLTAKGKKKEARTSYRALCRTEQASLLELTLHSGRQHQIRRQFAELGHPLFGDRRYGGPCPATLTRTFLHCRQLVFVDPYSGATVVINSPLPGDLEAFLGEIGLGSVAH